MVSKTKMYWYFPAALGYSKCNAKVTFPKEIEDKGNKV